MIWLFLGGVVILIVGLVLGFLLEVIATSIAMTKGECKNN